MIIVVKILLYGCLLTISCHSQNTDREKHTNKALYQIYSQSKKVSRVFKTLRNTIGIEDKSELSGVLKGTTEFLGNTCDLKSVLNANINNYTFEITANPIGFSVYESEVETLISDFSKEIRPAGIMEIAELKFNRYTLTHEWLFDTTYFRWQFERETPKKIELSFKFEIGTQAAPIYGKLMVSKSTWLPENWTIQYADRTETIELKGRLENAPYWFPKEVLATSNSGGASTTRYNTFQPDVNLVLNETYIRLLQLQDFKFDAAEKASQYLALGNRGHLLVKASVNDNIPQWFILDSGAGISVLDQNYKTSLGLNSKGIIDLVGVGDQIKIYCY